MDQVDQHLCHFTSCESLGPNEPWDVVVPRISKVCTEQEHTFSPSQLQCVPLLKQAVDVVHAQYVCDSLFCLNTGCGKLRTLEGRWISVAPITDCSDECPNGL